MGLFGGGNSSSTTNAQSAGFSTGGGAAVQLMGSNNKLTLSDQGAIKAAQTIAGEALDQVNLAQQNSSNTAAAALKAVTASAQGQTQSILLEGIKWAALVGIAFFAMKAFSKG